MINLDFKVVDTECFKDFYYDDEDLGIGYL